MMQISFKGTTDFDLDIPDWVNNHPRRETTEVRMPKSHTGSHNRTGTLSALNQDTYVSRHKKRVAARKKKRRQNAAKGLSLVALVGAMCYGVTQLPKPDTKPNLPDETPSYTEQVDLPDDGIEIIDGSGTIIECGATPEPTSELQIMTQEKSCFDFKLNLCDEQEYSIKKFVRKWEENKERYQKIEKQTGIPAELVAAIHWRESAGNFNCCLNDGTPLGEPVKSPIGKGQIFNSFEESAIYVLNKKASGITIEKGDYEAYFDFAESYNGYGYSLYHDMNSPYVWAGSEYYTCGKYVADGSFNPNYVDKQPGVAVLLKYILDK